MVMKEIAHCVILSGRIANISNSCCIGKDLQNGDGGSQHTNGLPHYTWHRILGNKDKLEYA